MQPYGAEASAFTQSQLQGQQVGLEFDDEKTDRYGRLLAYVYSPDDTMFNETLLRKVTLRPPLSPERTTWTASLQPKRRRGRPLEDFGGCLLKSSPKKRIVGTA